MQRETSTKDGDNRVTTRALCRFGNLFYDRTILVLVVMFLAGMAGVLWQVSHVQSGLVNTIALENASVYSDALTQFRTLYTSEVVKSAKAYGMEITHDYETKEGAIPLPVTLSMMLGNRLAKSKPGGKTELYSDYPFPWRRATGGLTDEFAKEAWQHLKKEPSQPYYQFENYLGTPSLRYATADLMRASCINCHNSHPETPKNDWKLGDVRGVLEVSIPLDVAIAKTNSGLRGTFALMMGLGVLGVTALMIVIGRLRRSTVELEQRVDQRTASLGESEARMHAIVDTAADGIITIDDKGIIESFNGAAESIFGYAESEVIGENVSFLMPPSYREEHDTYLRRYSETGVRTILDGRREVSGRRKDGSTFPMDLCVSEAHVGDRRIFTGIVRDISERKHREEEIARHSRFLETVIESLDHPFLVIDAEDYSVRMANAAARRGASTSVRTCHAMTHYRDTPCDGAEHACPLAEVKRTGKPFMVEHVHTHADGSPMPVEVHAFPVLDDSGRIVQLIEYSLDITARKKAEDELWQSRQEIENANAELTESNRELEQFNTLAVGRELRMIELKEEINALLSKQGDSPKYEIVNDEVSA